jgi:hypothetical protein
VCAGGCATFEASPNLPGYTFSWSCNPPVAMVPGNNTYSIEICPATATEITLVVTNPDGCQATLKKTVIICPNQ